MTLRYFTNKSWRHTFSSVLVFGWILFGQLEKSSAQTLDQQVQQLLQNSCTNLNIGPNGSQLGIRLQDLCGVTGNQTGPAASVGGGAASVQGSAASILNRVVRQRLDQITKEDGQEPKKTSSLLFNPMGFLSSGFGFNPSVSSPFYIATSGDGSSSGVFSTSSNSRWNGLGFFASGLVESLNRDITTFQDGYKSHIFGFTGGADYRFSRKLVAGLAFSYSNSDGDFRSGGNFSTNSYGGLLFASYLPSDRTFVQLTGGYTRNKYLVSRFSSVSVTNPFNNQVTTTNGLASSNSNGNVFAIGFLSGYDHPVGLFTIGPRVGVTYSNTQIGDYTENGGTGIELKYDAQWIHSLQSVLGIQASTAFSTSFGVLVPQFNADYIHEFANSQRLITVQFAQDFRDDPTKFQFKNDVPVRNYANLGTGLVMVFPNGWQSFVYFRGMVGNEQFTNYAGTFGLRIEM